MDNFFLPHKKSAAAVRIRKMPKRSIARIILSMQTFQSVGELLHQWLIDELVANLTGEIEEHIIPGRCGYVIERLKLVYQHYNEDEKVKVSEYDTYLARKHEGAYKMIYFVKNWINRGLAEGEILDTMREIDEVRDQQQKFYLELNKLF